MVLPESSFFIIPTIFLLIVMVTVLMAKKGWKAKRPNAELTEMENEIIVEVFLLDKIYLTTHLSLKN